MTQPVKSQEITDICSRKGSPNQHRTMSSIFSAAFYAPLPVAVGMGVMSGEIGLTIIIQVTGYLIALLGAVIFGLPFYRFASERKWNSYMSYCIAGLVSGLLIALPFAFYITEPQAAGVLLAGALTSSWMCASAFWYLRVRAEVLQ